MKSCIKLILSVIVSSVFLSFFSFIYCYTGIHISNPNGSTDYTWKNNQYMSTMKEGFSWLKMDKNGYNNPSDCDITSLDILIMGSSHMEAVNVSQDENTCQQLRKLLPGYSIYNIGISGHTIYQCTRNLSCAVQEYHPRKYIIIETDHINLKNDEMIKVLNNTLEIIPSYESGFLYYIQKLCPAIKILYKNFSDWHNLDKNTDDNNRMNDNEIIDQEVLLEFIDKMNKDSGDVKMILLYHPKTKIDYDGNLIVNPDQSNNIAVLCQANNVIFIDMTEDFLKLFNTLHILPHGFINTGIGSSHLNKYGHQVIAERLAQVIMEDQQK